MTEEKEPTTNPALETIRRHWAFRAATLLVPSIVASIMAYTGAAGDARVEAQVVKDKAESGYQVTKDAVKDLQERVAQLADELAALKRAVRAGSKKVVPAVKIVVTPPAPAPLPSSLDKALEVKAPEVPKP